MGQNKVNRIKQTTESDGRFIAIHGYSSWKDDRRSTLGYENWVSMRKRCLTPGFTGYERYGGKGITVCERWSDFENFLADMGPRPSRKHSIDRFPDKNGNYEPSNCRWATSIEQGRNRVNNRLLAYKGETLPFSEWVVRLNLSRSQVYFRLKKGWTIERAFEEPSIPREQRGILGLISRGVIARDP